jgi:hypothetical protein
MAGLYFEELTPGLEIAHPWNSSGAAVPSQTVMVPSGISISVSPRLYLVSQSGIPR